MKSKPEKRYVYGAYIKSNSLLLILRKNLWDLPGGKFDGILGKKEEEEYLKQMFSKKFGISIRPLLPFKYREIIIVGKAKIRVSIWIIDAENFPDQIGKAQFFPALKLFDIPVSATTKTLIMSLCTEEFFLQLKPSL